MKPTQSVKSVGVFKASIIILLAGILSGSPCLRAQQGNDRAPSAPAEVNVRFATSALAVREGQFVDAPQIATVGINGNDNYLTSQPNGANDPDWNPSGTRIYYWAISDGSGAIFWIPRGGGASTRVNTGCGADPNCLGDHTPAVSPNGRRLLTERAFLPIDARGNATNVSIFEMNIGGSDAIQITFPLAGTEEDHAPRWSPDGDRLVFQRLDQNTLISSIWIANADGTNAHAVSPTGMDVGDPDWSPDGDEIVFQSPADSNLSTPQQIYKIYPDGTHLLQLTHYAIDPNLPVKTFRARWSPDGSKIAFAHRDSATTKGGPGNLPCVDIFVMDPDGGEVFQVTHTPDAEGGPVWDTRPLRRHNEVLGE